LAAALKGAVCPIPHAPSADEPFIGIGSLTRIVTTKYRKLSAAQASI
jgi:hypothetical protein